MLELVIYGVGFFAFTIVIQVLLYQTRKNNNKGNVHIWVGSNAVVVICVLGLITKNINYLAAVLGFVVADEIGKAVGWH
jgi:hypothetical protein